MSSGTVRAALYARVSSEQQAQAGTIDSQLEALRRRVAEERLRIEAELEFVDEGYSGATLVRPGLERLWDMAAAGCVDVELSVGVENTSDQNERATGPAANAGRLKTEGRAGKHLKRDFRSQHPPSSTARSC
jgi:hypothetical protein